MNSSSNILVADLFADCPMDVVPARSIALGVDTRSLKYGLFLGGLISAAVLNGILVGLYWVGPWIATLL